ncbi:2,3-bisphosphoglycerate-dependent phosphoglycerate mutase [Nitrospira defluvii]|uniref:2,3-bisphosphoglycerate-dependent phosphoglycerate mutase n=1 Tax=Nitrospira defluvii TaxID=330214 RepID=A0ABN7LX65_9BACT|nr:2,3-bisphosphoglycerate-dependent phosphoglycerate mutase [Nitrospira defluvii]CAE6770761.1 2,3-bisphosphoglycerate-dependent phosphoglycerate mutase [Nitrospira defluvii]
MGHFVLLRHGQSQWNLENRFTGWIDVPLSTKGGEEALAAAQQLSRYRLDRAFTSKLVRATDTLRIVLAAIGQGRIPIEENQALNERMYGDLQGLNKDETVNQYGAKQVEVWRRSYDVRPPGGESLKDTAARVLPYYQERIQPAVEKGDTVLIVAHGNSLRALVMHLEDLSSQQIVDLTIPTGALVVYALADQGKLVRQDRDAASRARKL